MKYGSSNFPSHEEKMLDEIFEKMSKKFPKVCEVMDPQRKNFISYQSFFVRLAKNLDDWMNPGYSSNQVDNEGNSNLKNCLKECSSKILINKLF
jgi:hypothetical protein